MTHGTSFDVETSLRALPEHLREALTAELDPGESLRWVGRPLPSRARKRIRWLCVAGGLFLSLYASMAARAAWTMLVDLVRLEAWRSSLSLTLGTIAISLVALVLVSAVLFIVFGIPILAGRRAARTVFAMTPTRLLRVYVDRHGLAHTGSLEPAHPLHIERTPFRDGTSDLVFHPSRNSRVFRFDAVPGGQAVDRLARATFDPV